MERFFNRFKKPEEKNRRRRNGLGYENSGEVTFFMSCSLLIILYTIFMATNMLGKCYHPSVEHQATWSITTPC